MPLPQGRGPYNTSSGDNATDGATYNPQADARADNAEYNPEYNDADQPLGARGADNQPSGVNPSAEDRDASRSEKTGKIPKGEIDDLMANRFPGEGDISGRTRGKKVDAFKQERGVDVALDETGISSAQQDVEIGRATGR